MGINGIHAKRKAEKVNDMFLDEISEVNDDGHGKSVR